MATAPESNHIHIRSSGCLEDGSVSLWLIVTLGEEKVIWHIVCSLGESRVTVYQEVEGLLIRFWIEYQFYCPEANRNNDLVAQRSTLSRLGQ